MKGKLANAFLVVATLVVVMAVILIYTSTKEPTPSVADQNPSIAGTAIDVTKADLAAVDTIDAKKATATHKVDNNISKKKRRADANMQAVLTFPGAKSQEVTLTFTNHTNGPIQLAKEGYYMDDVGSAESWEAESNGAEIAPGETVALIYHLEAPACHGYNSVLVFFIYRDGTWLLGKTGINYGTEYYQNHN